MVKVYLPLFKNDSIASTAQYTLSVIASSIWESLILMSVTNSLTDSPTKYLPRSLIQTIKITFSPIRQYCKFGNFRENFIFANSVKRHICDVQTSQLRHDFTISVNDRVVLLFREGLTFTKLRICEVSRK